MNDDYSPTRREMRWSPEMAWLEPTGAENLIADARESPEAGS